MMTGGYLYDFGKLHVGSPNDHGIIMAMLGTFYWVFWGNVEVRNNDDCASIGDLLLFFLGGMYYIYNIGLILN